MSISLYFEYPEQTLEEITQPLPPQQEQPQPS
jgi:hypothetical protein